MRPVPMFLSATQSYLVSEVERGSQMGITKAGLFQPQAGGT